MHGDVELVERLQQVEGFGDVAGFDMLNGVGEEHGAVLEGEVEMLQLDHAVADGACNGDTLFVDALNGAVETALHGMFHGETCSRIDVADGLVEHKGQRRLVHAPAMGVVDVEEINSLGAVEPELHVFDFIVDKAPQYWVFKGHTSQFGIVFLCKFGKTDTRAHLAALVGVLYHDFNGIHDKK